MSVREYQIRYSLVFGVLAVLVGLALSFWIAPTEPRRDIPFWKLASFVYLNAHGLSVVADRFPQYMTYAPGEVVILEGSAQRAIRLLPVALVSIATLLVNVGMGRTKRRDYIARNSLYAAGRYFTAILVLILVSNARPVLRFGILAILVAGVALWIGSHFVGRAVGGLPIFGIASLGALFLVGIFILAVGWAFIQVMLPVAVVSLLGATVGAVGVYMTRNFEW